MSTDEDLRRDPHLETALRHAPDADVTVPPLLRARIVAAAQRSAEGARRPASWLARLDDWLTPKRLGGAGTAVAAVLAATVLWVGRDEQPPATTVATRSPPPAAAAPAAGEARKESADAAQSAPTAAVPQPATTATDRAAFRRSDEGANRLQAPGAPAATRPATPPPPLAGAVVGAASPSPPPPGNPRAFSASPFPAEGEERSRELARSPRRAGAPAGAPTPAAAPSPAAQGAEMARSRQAPAAPEADRRALTDAANGGSALAQAAPSRFVEGWLADPTGWRRRMAGGEEVGVDATWLAGLARAAAGRWSPVATSSRDASEAGRETWLLNGPNGRSARFDWSAEVLVVCDLATNRCEQAVLGETALGALRRSFR